ncbi:hypothetical protein V6Z12_D13G226300 [Gossypium hirsutum]
MQLMPSCKELLPSTETSQQLIWYSFRLIPP